VPTGVLLGVGVGGVARKNEKKNEKMRARNDKSLDVIGNTLRDTWRELVASPLPERIQRLLDELDRTEDKPRKPGARRKRPH
jgi:hypothetical protein